MTVKEVLEAELKRVQTEYLRVDTEIHYAELSRMKLHQKRYELGNKEEELVWALQDLYGAD